MTGWARVPLNKPDPQSGSILTATVLALAICFSLVFAMAQTKTPSAAMVPLFEDVSHQADLSVSHISTAEQHYIIESMSGGIALFDCDDDGKLDIAMVNGSTVEHYRNGGDPLVTLYHQDANLKFNNITPSAGLARKGWGMGITVADFDNDGKLDLFVTGFGGSALYRGLGNCKVEDVTEKAGVRGTGFMTGAAWADYDRDGFVDLFVARYVHLDMGKLRNSAAMKNSAATREFSCNAVPGAWKAKAICFSTTAAMEPSRRSPRRQELTILGTAMDLGLCGATTMTTAGPICT